MKAITLSKALLFALPVILAPATAYCADAGNAKFNEEFAKQQRIYNSTADDTPGGYIVDRRLNDYTEILSPEFAQILANLGPLDRWLDIGAGSGRAILDYYASTYDLQYPEGWQRRGRKAQAVAISIEDRRTVSWYETAAHLGSNQIRYLSSKRFGQYSPEELGKFQVISDVLGGFSYSDQISVFIEKALAILDLKGSLHMVLQDVKTEQGTNAPHYKGSPFLTEITDADGSEVKICSWLKSISCVQVTCEAKTGWKPPIEAYHVRKICNDVSVPALELKHYSSGTPPERRFELKRAVQSSANN